MLDLSVVTSQWRVIIICLFVCIAAFQFGYDSTYFGGILVMEPFVRIYGYIDPSSGKYILSAKTQSLVSSIINAGEFVGATTAFFIGDRFGRRGGLFISSALVCVGAIFQLAGDHLGLLIVGRLLLGYAIGLISCFVPLYVADCAPARLRGALVTLYQFVIGLGLLLGVCVDDDTKDRIDTGAFRIPMGVQFVFPIVLIPGLLFLAPESPRWLVAHNKHAEAKKALQRLRKADDEAIDSELAAIELAAEQNPVHGLGSWSEIFTWGPEGRKAYLGFAIQAFQQASGVNFITSYGVLFFTTVGIVNPFFVQAGIFIVGMPPTIASQYLIERFGRRPILLISGACMACSSLIMGGLGLASNKTYTLDQAIAAMVYVFIIFFSVGWGPTVWVVCSELSTGRNRNKLMSLSTGANWFFTWLISFTFPYLYDANAVGLGARIGFIYGALMVCACVWVFFLLPETAQRSLEEIDEMFQKGVPARKFLGYVCEGSVSVQTELATKEKVEVDHVHVEGEKD